MGASARSRSGNLRQVGGIVFSFWMSRQAGRKAAGAICDAIDGDADSRVREKAVFAVSQLPSDHGRRRQGRVEVELRHD
jgi:hypothetical protein